MLSRRPVVLAVALFASMLSGQDAAPPAADTALVIAPGAIQPHLAADAHGRFYAAFLHDGNVALSVSTDGGKTFTRPVVAIDAHGKARGGMQRGPRVAVDAAGTIYVTAPLCFDEAELGKRYPVAELYLAVSGDGGATFAPPLQINDADKTAPESLHWSAVGADGTLFVAWLDRRQRTEPGQDLAFTRVTERGTKVEANRVLPGPLCECCAPGIAVAGAGNPIVVYREGGAAKNRPLQLLRSNDGGATFQKPRRLNHGDSRVDG